MFFVISAFSADTLMEKIQVEKDPIKKLKLLEKYLKIANTPRDDEESVTSPEWRYFLETEIIKTAFSADNRISIKEILTKIDRKEHEVNSVDLDNDGNIEIWFGLAGPEAPTPSDILVYSKNGTTKYIEFGELWGIHEYMCFDYKNKKDKVIFFIESGGNGAGVSKGYALGYKDDNIAQLFTLPDSHYGGIRFADIDNDGNSEIIYEMQIEYKQTYLPLIYSWNGENFIDTTCNYPQNMITFYKKLNLNQRIKVDNKLLQNSKEYMDFWDKYLKPIKDEAGI